MPEVVSYLIYRCNGCGYQYDEPSYCSHCGTIQCPKCDRTGCITIVPTLGQAVSDNIPLAASELKRNSSKRSGTKNKKKTSKKKRSLAELSEKLGIKLDL